MRWVSYYSHCLDEEIEVEKVANVTVSSQSVTQPHTLILYGWLMYRERPLVSLAILQRCRPALLDLPGYQEKEKSGLLCETDWSLLNSGKFSFDRSLTISFFLSFSSSPLGILWYGYWWHLLLATMTVKICIHNYVSLFFLDSFW